MRTRLKNRIHVLLDRRHVPPPPVTDVFGKRGTAYLKKLALPGVDGEILRENLDLLETFDTLITEAEHEIQRLVKNAPRVNLLRTIPGHGLILAVVVALEIDDISRFGAAPRLTAQSL
jgi:transposase